MERTNETKSPRPAWGVLMITSVVATFTAALLTSQSRTRETHAPVAPPGDTAAISWHDCFPSKAAAQEAGETREQATFTVQQRRRDHDRMAQLHRHSLKKLLTDGRHEDPEQQPFLDVAAAQSLASAESYEAAAEEAGATGGCLDAL